MPGKLTDAQYQDRLRRVLKLRKMQSEDDIKSLLEHQWGRRLAYYLIFELAGVHRGSFAGSIKDGAAAAQHMAFSEGTRSVGLSLAEKIQTLAPESYVCMMQEHMAQRSKDLALEEDDG